MDDLVAATPDDPGRWCTTAKELRFLDLAADLARRSPVDIGTLLRAARHHLDQAPKFALAAATAALHWMARGQFYELNLKYPWYVRYFPPSPISPSRFRRRPPAFRLRAGPDPIRYPASG